ncbi:type II secretion system GspH family protein [Patescibacteria group bacterium]|nr:type II secretion system GspH family protein [Patescibacteria group bacterium]
MQKKIKNKIKLASGFTLIETLFGISIFILIVILLTLFSRNVWIYNSFVAGGLADTNAGRQVLKTLTSEIRTASTANTGAYTISLATATAFTFYSDIDNDGLKEKVRYFLSETSLQKGTTKPTGSPLTYNPANETISTLIDKLANSVLFEYYDRNYDGNTAPLSSPVNIPDIRLVKVTIVLDKDPNRSPTPMTFSTQVSIRNLKDNL